MGSRSRLLARLLAITAGVAVVASAFPGRAAMIVFDTSESELTTAGTQSKFDARLAPGSTLTLETDANHDGIEGDVTVAASHLILDGVFPRGFGGGLGSFSVNAVAQITRGLGTAANFNGSIWPIQWTEPARFSIAGTIECSGTDCPFAPDTLLPLDVLYTSTGSYPLSFVDLGTWNGFDGYFSFFPVICAEAPCSKPNDPQLEVALYLTLPPNDVFQVLYLRGKPVPEPAVALLVVGGLAALAVRRRASL